MREPTSLDEAKREIERLREAQDSYFDAADERDARMYHLEEENEKLHGECRRLHAQITGIRDLLTDLKGFKMGASERWILDRVSFWLETQ